MLSKGGVFTFQSEVSDATQWNVRPTSQIPSAIGAQLFVLGCLQEDDILVLALLGGGSGRRRRLPQGHIQRPEQLREVKVG